MKSRLTPLLAGSLSCALLAPMIYQAITLDLCLCGSTTAI